jgi:hydrogenase maturation protease
MNHANTLIVGIGSPHGDDVAGWKVAELLANDLDQNGICVKKATSPIQILDWIESVDELILCDACRGLGDPGDVRQWDWPAHELVHASWSGTHDFSLTASLQLADRLDRLPPKVVIWTVEAAMGDTLDAMSPAVGAAVPTLVRLIASELVRSANSKGEACTNNHL